MIVSVEIIDRTDIEASAVLAAGFIMIGPMDVSTRELPRGTPRLVKREAGARFLGLRSFFSIGCLGSV